MDHSNRKQPIKFTVQKLEKAFAYLVKNENNTHHSGITIKRAPEEVLIQTSIKNFPLSFFPSAATVIFLLNPHFPNDKNQVFV